MTWYVPTQPAAASPPSRHPWAWLLLVLLITGLWTWRSAGAPERGAEVPYSTAIQWVREHKVAEAVIQGPELRGTLRLPAPHAGRLITEFVTIAPDDERLVPLLDAHAV